MKENKFNEEILKSFNEITGYIENDRYSNLEIQQFLLSTITKVREDERKKLKEILMTQHNLSDEWVNDLLQELKDK